MNGQSPNHHQPQNSLPAWLKRLIILILLPFSATLLLMIVRHQGYLQRYELKAFDLLMYTKKKLIPLIKKMEESEDSRILIVTIDAKDSDYLKKRYGLEDPFPSLPDEAFTELLDKLDRLNKDKYLIIGSDIYHKGNFEDELAKRLENDYRFFVVCQIPNEKLDSRPPPSNIISEESWGFSNVTLDKDGIVRRHFLAQRPHPTAPCSTEYSFSYMLAHRYLSDKKGIKITRNKEGDLKFNGVLFRLLTSHSSGYQGLDARGDQILLNYRYNCYRENCSLRNVARYVPLQNILKDGINADQLDDRLIILIGVIESKIFPPDIHNTPDGEEIPGVFLHAQMLSQILSAVLDDRSLIGWWSLLCESIWIFGWSLLGAILGFLIRNRKRLYLVLAVSLAIGVQFIFSLFMFVDASIWIPLVPAILVFLVTVLPVVFFGDDLLIRIDLCAKEIFPWYRGIRKAIDISDDKKD